MSGKQENDEEFKIEDIEDDESYGSYSGGADSELDTYSEDEEDDEEEDDDKEEVEVNKVQELEPDKSDDEEENNDSDDDDEDYLQKLDDQYKNRVIENFHPELKTLNYEEINMLAIVVRNKDNIIIDPLHKTLPVLTRYEKARILGERAKQINMGAKPFVEVEPSMMDGYLIALKELEQKVIPFIIQRPLPNGGSEYWRIRDLEII